MYLVDVQKRHVSRHSLLVGIFANNLSLTGLKSVLLGGIV